MTTTKCAVPECMDSLFVEHPLALCRRHAIQVSQHVTDILYARALVGSIPQAVADRDAGNLIECATLADPAVWKQSTHPSVVYFLANGNRVKIGTSTNLRSRVSALSLRRNDALLVLDGDHNLEADLHRIFNDDRVGGTEWFTLSPLLQSFIASKGGEEPRSAPIVAAQGAKVIPVAGTDPRRQVVFDIVSEAEASGIGPAAILEAFSRRSPGIEAPHPDVIARWLSADARFHRVRHGRYAVRPDQQ